MNILAAVTDWLLHLYQVIQEKPWGWLFALTSGAFLSKQGVGLVGSGSYAIGRLVGGMFLPHTIVKGEPGRAATFVGVLFGHGMQLFGLILFCMGIISGVDHLLYGADLPGESSADIAHRLFPGPTYRQH